MDSIGIAISAIIVSILTNVLKTPIDSYSPARVAIIRTIATGLSLVASLLIAWISHTPFDQSVVGVFVDAALTLIGATGIFHFASKQ